MMPPTVKVLAKAVIVREAESVTAPVPIFSSFVPMKPKSPPQVWA